MILVDTGPLVAICDARDALHAVAMRSFPKMAGFGLSVCEPVLVEACFHLPGKSQRLRLAALLDEFRVACLPTYEPAFQRDVFGWLDKYPDHAPDWADGCIACLCGRDPRLKVWTYDREFRSTWRKPDGKAIALAVRG